MVRAAGEIDEELAGGPGDPDEATTTEGMASPIGQEQLEVFTTWQELRKAADDQACFPERIGELRRDRAQG